MRPPTNWGETMFEEFHRKERQGWGSKADFYHEHTALITTQAIPTLLRAVRVRAGANLLDICSGPGYAAGAAQAICATATGVDFAPAMVEMARRNFPDCAFHEGDAMRLELADDSFDAAVCPFGIFHVTDPETAISEGYRVIKPGARYAFSQWCTPADSEFFRLALSAIAKHADMSLADPAPDAFRLSDRALCSQIMSEVGFVDLEIEEVPSVYHAPEGDFFDNVMRLTVRGAMIVEMQSPEVQAAIRAEMNEAAKAYSNGEVTVLSVPSFVVSGRK